MWRNVVPGPDWMDLSRRVKEIEDAHRVELLFTISFGGSLDQPAFAYNFIAIASGQPDLEGQWVQGVRGDWPCKDHSTLEGCLHDALYHLDYCIGRTYEQMNLWPQAGGEGRP